MKLKTIIAKILKGIPAGIILISGIAGLAAKYFKLADIGYGSGITLIIIFLLYLFGIYLDRKPKENSVQELN